MNLQILHTIPSSESNRNAMIQSAVEDFITTFQAAGRNPNLIRDDLHALYKKNLMDGNMYEWVLTKCASIVIAEEHNSPSTETKLEMRKIFCKETTNNAVICCTLVSSKSTECCVQTLCSTRTQHSLSSVVVSAAKNEKRYIIACELRSDGFKTYYIAFRGEPELQKWLKLQSFEGGKF